MAVGVSPQHESQCMTQICAGFCFCVRSLKDVIGSRSMMQTAVRKNWAGLIFFFFVNIIKTEWENHSIFPAALDLV